MTSPSPSMRTALVAGATGVAGAGIVDHLARCPGWRVLALQRRPAPAVPRPNVTVVNADLHDAAGLRRALAATPVTHLVYAGHAREAMKVSPRPMNPALTQLQLKVTSRTLLPLLRAFPSMQAGVYEKVGEAAGSTDRQGRNLDMLRNLLAVLTEAPHRLEHVAMVTGLKYNGMHLGPALYPAWKLPITEESPRPPGPNWYYELEAHLAATAKGFTWSVARPSFIVGEARNAPYNLGTGLAVYASLMKALNRPLIFPGGRKLYEQRIELSSGEGLARFLEWSTTADGARNQAFSYVNGDVTRWSELWPAFAEFFGMGIEVPRIPVGVEKMLAGRGADWLELVRRHDLQPTTLEEVLPLRFIDQGLGIGWELAVSMEKARRAGFAEVVSSREMFLSLFQRLRDDRLIP